MAVKEPDLSPAELEVLSALWDLGPTTVRQVMEHLHGRGRKVAYTTVLTFLSRLEQKGVVASDRSGQAYVYRPVLSKKKVTRSRLRSMLDLFYDGAAGQLVLQLVKEESLAPEEVAELQKLIDRLDQAGTRNAGRRRGSNG